MVFHDTQVLARPASRLPTAQPTANHKLLFASFCHSTTWNGASRIFQAEGKKLLRMAQTLPRGLLGRRVLIEPLCGIDNGLCRWSVEMILEHLIETGCIYAEIIIQLSHGETPWRKVDLAAAMPHGGNGIEIIGHYRNFLDDFGKVLMEDIGERNQPVAYPHPWYGRLDVRHWHSLAAFHQSIHRDQMERIVSALG
jgi:hypothetical protein